MSEAFICDYIRTPIGRFAGSLASVRTDDLAAVPLKALIERNAAVDWDVADEVILGCANQAGEDNRKVARMAALLAGLPVFVPGSTINRLCGSGMDEAFASQGLATLRGLGVADNDPRVNPNGGAIALGHPLGMSGCRIVGTAALQLSLTKSRRALATMCVGVGQGVAIALERI